MQEAIVEINRLREMTHGKNIQDVSVLMNIKNHIANSAVLKELPIAQILNQDIETHIQQNGKGRFNRLKHYINETENNFIFSAFSAPYFEELSLDGFCYERLYVPEKLRSTLPSPACPVKLTQTTVGFSSNKVVALFPENHIDHAHLPEDKIFYFIDRFVARFFSVTKPLLNLFESHQLTSLQIATTSEIEYAATCWVHLHEHFHHQGLLPISQYLDIKSTKATAGLEELRVDLLSILACLEYPNFLENAHFVAEFILIERLMRYGVESPDRLSYDAISSQFLFRYLLEHDGLEIIGRDKIRIQPRIFIILKQLVLEINTIESQIDNQEPKDVKINLSNFVKCYVDYDVLNKTFLHDASFRWITTHRKVANAKII